MRQTAALTLARFQTACVSGGDGGEGGFRPELVYE